MEKIKISEREKICAFTIDGKERNGIPVIGNEWMRLQANTPVILVDSLEEMTPIEHFFVAKRKFTKQGDQASKRSPVKVFATNPNE